MKILVFGSDGFCAWPMSLHLAKSGHTILGVDNLSRRRIDKELGSSSLTPIAEADHRILVARSLGYDLELTSRDVTDFLSVFNLIRTYQPDAIFHTAEIRSAPYSMMSPEHKNRTISNNIQGTHNLLNAIVELGLQDKTHLVHIGTMGVYGYGGTDAVLPEGYVDVTLHGQDENGNPVDDKRQILYPTNPGSVYHMTKSMEQILFAFYAKNDKVRITDLHQGIIWGSQTEDTSRDLSLMNRLDYDETYGTVLNRFLIQSQVGHPLTVYGTGGQTRAFINIRDSAKCVQWAIEDLNYDGRVRIINQVAEFKSVGYLANLVSEKTGATVNQFDNPRKELAENKLKASYDYFKSRGLVPITIESALQDEIELIKTHGNRINKDLIPPKTRW